jgi:hypothetical protein
MLPASDLNERSLPEALATLGDLLASRGQKYEVVAIGGSALLLFGYVHRSTRDLDIVALIERGKLVSAGPLPPALAEAVVDVARAVGLRPDWLNPGPTSVLELGLPEGFASRLEARTYGGLTLHLAGRRDLIALKLYAAVDQGPESKHTSDLRALAPTADELLAGARWSRTQDPSEGFRSQLVQTLAFFGVDDYGDL